ncbi:MAG: HAMP domain-containing sensor histidine kinase [Verrucomicrobiota bacterium]
MAFTAPASGLPPIHGNYSQLLQVFLNLFQNAIHALDGRPAPRVEVRAQVVGGEDDARVLVLAVADNGTGIEPALLARIFEPFITTKATGNGPQRGGMGLGLAIVKRIVEGHRGAITATSETGQGTTFLIHLPCLR